MPFIFSPSEEWHDVSSKSTIRLRVLSGHHSDWDSLLRSCLSCRRRSSAAESLTYRSSREFLLVSLLLKCVLPLPPLRMREPRDEAAAFSSRGLLVFIFSPSAPVRREWYVSHLTQPSCVLCSGLRRFPGMSAVAAIAIGAARRHRRRLSCQCR